ncbi:MAG TPA: hypothetical protein P5511_00915, partial [Candidatus Goldiibacteriota bacterium]|nr:hypothetical protein [Candidatus Goldiibacteriota bacterium]
MRYVKIAVFSNIDNLLTYSAETAGSGLAGRRVVVPLGSDFCGGIIVDELDKPDIDTSKIKPVREILDDEPVLDSRLIKLGLKAAEYYACGPGMVFSAMLAPLSRVKTRKIIRLTGAVPEGLSGAEAELAAFLAGRRMKRAGMKDIQKAFGSQASRTVEQLVKKGVVYAEGAARLEKSRSEIAEPKKSAADTKTVTLNAEQASAAAAINSALDAGKYGTFLLMGITGSGKTEIYIKCAEHCVKSGRKVIVL